MRKMVGRIRMQKILLGDDGGVLHAEEEAHERAYAKKWPHRTNNSANTAQICSKSLRDTKQTVLTVIDR
jgi:hypothetical protein